MGQTGVINAMYSGNFEDDDHREALLAIRTEMKKTLDALTVLGRHHAAAYLDLAIWQITPQTERLHALSDVAIDQALQDWR